MVPVYDRDKFENNWKRLEENKPSHTLVAHLCKDTYSHIHPTEPRGISVREAARIQSFPDDFVFFGNITEVRRQIGNAVPPVGVHAIAKALMPLFRGEYERVDLYEEQKRLCQLPIEERIKLF